MYGIYLKWKKSMDTVPKRPSEWATLALEAETDERWGDAHYYWLEGSTAYTDNPKKAREMQLKALEVFEKYQNCSGK